MAPHKDTSISQRFGSLIAGIARGAPLKVSRVLALPAALALVLVAPLGAYTAAQVLEHVAAQSSTNSGSQLIGRADAHLDNDLIEMSVSITQTESACQAPLNGQYCLRYSMAVNDKPVQMGYGLIPTGDVNFKGTTISVDVDTSTSRFHHVVGSGGPISVSWTWQSTGPPVTVANQTSTLSPASAQGTVIGQTLAGAGLVASVLLYSSG